MYLFITNVYSTKGHSEKPKNSPNDAFIRVVWASSMIFFLFIYLFVTHINSTQGHDDKRQKSPNDAFRRVVWASGKFFFVQIYIFTYSPPAVTSQPLHYGCRPDEIEGWENKKRAARLPFVLF